MEARLALRDEEPDYEDGRGVEGSRFTVWDVTSGLPDDSREADDRRAERALRDLRARVKAARGEASRYESSEESPARDPGRLLAFCARWGITREQFREGVAASRRE